MALNVLQGVYPESSINKGLETGLKGLMDQLAQHKEKQNLQSGLKTLYPNLSSERIQGLSNLPLPFLKLIFERGVEFPEEMQQQNIQNQLADNTEQQISPLSSLEALNLVTQRDQLSPERLQELQQLYSQPQRQIEQDFSMGAPKQKQSSQAKLGLTPQEKALQEKINLKQRDIEQKERSEVQSLKKEAYEINRAAKNKIRDYNKMLELDEKGELDSPGFSAFLENAGLGSVNALRSPGSEQFINIRKNFFSGLKDTFGSRLNQFEVEQYLDAIPGLLNSREGRRRMIHTQKLIEQGKVAQFEVINDIIRENDGRVPKDYYEQLDKRLDKKLDQISDKLRKEFGSIKLPEQHRAVTALQAGAGKVLGSLPKAGSSLGGALTGARIGSAYGPLGTAGGALLGGIVGNKLLS